MPKIVDKDAMRDRILDAALLAFAQNGITATSMAALSHSLGVAKGTLYLYFKSREEMVEALLDRHIRGLEDRLNSAPMNATLQVFAEDLARTMDPDSQEAQMLRVVFGVLDQGASGAADRLAAVQDRRGALYARQIAHLQSRNEVAPEHDAEALGRALVSMIDGMVLHRGLFAIPEPRHKRLVVGAVAALVLGLRADTLTP